MSLFIFYRCRIANNDLDKRVKWEWVNIADYWPSSTPIKGQMYAIQSGEFGFITFTCAWIGLQFRIGNPSLSFRIKYGNNDWTDWKVFATK